MVNPQTFSASAAFDAIDVPFKANLLMSYVIDQVSARSHDSVDALGWYLCDAANARLIALPDRNAWLADPARRGAVEELFEDFCNFDGEPPHVRHWDDVLAHAHTWAVATLFCAVEGSDL